MTTKQIKLFRIIAAVIVAIFFMPTIGGFFKRLVWPDMPPAARRRMPAPTQPQPVPPALIKAPATLNVGAAAAAVTKPPATPSAPGAPVSAASQDSFAGFTEFGGKWVGGGLVDRRGMAAMSIEIHEANGTYSAYTYLSCIPSTAAQPKLNPVVAVLTGKLEKGSLQFHVEKTLGAFVTEKTCPINAVAITPFGDNTVAAEWSDPCGGGQLLLRKLPR